MHSATESSRAARSSYLVVVLGFGLGGTGSSTADDAGGNGAPLEDDIVAQALEEKAHKDEERHKKGENSRPVHFGHEADMGYGEKKNFGCHSKAAFDEKRKRPSQLQ